jgi:hypothetical protein
MVNILTHKRCTINIEPRHHNRGGDSPNGAGRVFGAGSKGHPPVGNPQLGNGAPLGVDDVNFDCLVPACIRAGNVLYT